MEIKDIKPTAEITINLRGIGGVVQAETFTVKFLGLHQMPDYMRSFRTLAEFRQSQVITDALTDSIVGWTLTHDGGKPLECNEENKRKYLPYLLGLKVIREGADPEAKVSIGDLLAYELIEFAGDAENFLKN